MARVELIHQSCGRCGKDFQVSVKSGQRVRLYCDSICAHNWRGSAEYRFFEKVNKTETCWLWTASTRDGGYGGFWFEGRLVLAHRFSFELVNGPTTELLMHTCDVRLCVNPAHLKTGTLSENTQDMIRKGRAYWQVNRVFSDETQGGKRG